MNASVLDISSLIGLCAIVVLSFNFLLGLMLSTAYKRPVYWKHLPIKLQQISVQQVHNWTAYIAFALIVLHPIVLLFDKATKFLAADIFIHFHSSYQKIWVAMGVTSF
jgi:methionine sulfoxide reductase heme-binding subunit